MPIFIAEEDCSVIIITNEDLEGTIFLRKYWVVKFSFVYHCVPQKI